jgi:hypothetical protein
MLVAPCGVDVLFKLANRSRWCELKLDRTPTREIGKRCQQRDSCGDYQESNMQTDGECGDPSNGSTQERSER